MIRRSVGILVGAAALFVTTSPVMAVLSFEDGRVHNIDYAVYDSIRLDWAFPGLGTSVNILDGANIPYPYRVGGWHDSTINILGGSMGELNAGNNCLVSVSGGSIGELYARDNSQITIFGGLLGEDILLLDNAVLTVHGSGFAVDDIPVGCGEVTSVYGGYFVREPYRQLTGTLLGGEPLNSRFLLAYSSKIVLVPEPGTLLLLGLGGLFFRRRR